MYPYINSIFFFICRLNTILENNFQYLNYLIMINILNFIELCDYEQET